MSFAARRRPSGSRSRNQRGSSGSCGSFGFVGFVAALLCDAVDDDPLALATALGRSFSCDVGAADPRASAMAALAAVSVGYGPRTRGRPSSSVCSASTMAHVPDCGSIVKRSSRVCHRPPPRRRRPSSSVAFAAAIRRARGRGRSDGRGRARRRPAARCARTRPSPRCGCPGSSPRSPRRSRAPTYRSLT